jgi:hypothetical protein
MRNRAVHFIGLAVAVAVATSLSLGSPTPADADAGSSKPPPTDRSQKSAEGERKAATPNNAGKYKRNPLLKELLSEEDEGGAEPEPAASALCQRFTNAPNPFANPFPNVDQIRADAIVTSGNMAGCSTPQNETTIAVNPENPRNLVAGANDYRLFNTRENRNDSSGWAYTSFDGGRSWRNIQLPHLTFQTGAPAPLSYMDSAGDPVVAFGPANTVYYGNIAFSRAAPALGGTQPAGAITVNVSHDGGLTWSEPVIVAIDGVNPQGQPIPTTVFNDKVWLSADPRNGGVYVTWTRFADKANGDYLESPIVVARSDDFGRSFSAFTRVDPPLAQAGNGFTPFSQGSNPRVGRDGTLYIAYESANCQTVACDQPGDRDVTQIATSRDHGRTFRRVVIDTNFDFPLNEDAGALTLTGENFRINSYPQLAYDSTTDRLAVTWNDDRNGVYDASGKSVRTNGDNIVATSRSGSRWSTPVVVGTPQDEVFGAVAAVRRVVAVTSYTRHYDPSGVKLDYAAWSSRGKLRTAMPIHRVTTQSSDPQIQFVGAGLDSGKDLQGLFIGDYTAAALGADLRLHPSWTDFRGKPGVTKPNQDAYTATVNLRSGRRR